MSDYRCGESSGKHLKREKKNEEKPEKCRSDAALQLFYMQEEEPEERIRWHLRLRRKPAWGKEKPSEDQVECLKIGRLRRYNCRTVGDIN